MAKAKKKPAKSKGLLRVDKRVKAALKGKTKGTNPKSKRNKQLAAQLKKAMGG
jgi:hypothetical protein